MSLIDSAHGEDFTTGAGAIVVCAQKQFLRLFDVLRHGVVVPSRASALRVPKPGLFAINIVAVHMGPAPSVVETRRCSAALRDRVDAHGDEATHSLRDWNFVGAEGLRAQAGVETTGAGDPIARVIEPTSPSCDSRCRRLGAVGIASVRQGEGADEEEFLNYALEWSGAQ